MNREFIGFRADGQPREWSEKRRVKLRRRKSTNEMRGNEKSGNIENVWKWWKWWE